MTSVRQCADELLPFEVVDAAINHQRPARSAPVQAWLDYHRHAAAAYADLAEDYRWHYDEALFWARREREKAEQLQRTGVIPTE